MSLAAEQAGADLRAFVDASPSPFHAVAEMVRRLERAASRELDERERWTLAPGDARYVVRDGGSLIAFRVGSAPLPDAGVRMVGTHTDSPTFKVRPRYDVERGELPPRRRRAVRRAARPHLARPRAHRRRRLAVRGATARLDLPWCVLPGGPVRLPSLAIHLDRGVRDGLKLDPQTQLVPVWGARTDRDGTLLDHLAAVAGVDPGDVVGHDLVLADTPAVRGHRRRRLVGRRAAARQPRLLPQRHDRAARGGPGARTRSCSSRTTTRRSAAARWRARAAPSSRTSSPGSSRRPATTDPQDLHVTIARSHLVSADMAHAQHPTQGERHEP